MAKSCRLCEIYRIHEEPSAETDYFYVLFDEFPVAPGHALVVLKRHAASTFQLKQKEWDDLQKALKKAVKTIETADLRSLYKARLKAPRGRLSKKLYAIALKSRYLGRKPDAYTLGINEGRAAGRTIDHFHLQMIPRHFGDVPDGTGGIRGIFPQWANYKK